MEISLENINLQADASEIVEWVERFEIWFCLQKASKQSNKVHDVFGSWRQTSVQHVQKYVRP
jgi:hypothetical protein